MTQVIEVTVTMRLPIEQEANIRQMSVERVINTTTDILQSVIDSEEPDTELYDQACTNACDWDDAKPVVRNMWSTVHEALMKRLYEQRETQTS